MRGEQAIQYVIDLVDKSTPVQLDIEEEDKQVILLVLRDLLDEYYGRGRHAPKE